MSKQVVNAGRPLGPYSPAIVAGGHCYLAGFGGIDPTSGQVVPGGVTAETTLAFETARGLLKDAGYELADVVSVTCYLRHIEDWAAMSEVFGQVFAENPPTRAAVGGLDLPFGTNVEFTLIAWRDDKQPPR